jgi:hypothetical protein
VYVATSQRVGQVIGMAIIHKGARATRWQFSGDQHRTPCTIYHAVDYSKNVIRIGFPRTSVDDPEWVRLGVEITAQLIEDSRWCIDDAMTNGYAPDVRHAAAVHLSARLYPA